MKILVVGGSGYLGGEVTREALRSGHDVVATYFSSPGDAADVAWKRTDVREPSDVDAVLRRAEPDVVINTAYVQSDWRTTADGAANVAKAAARSGARLIQVSSDAVFSGGSLGYAEDAVPDPITPYGAAKAAAETAVCAIDPAAAIVRTSLIVGDGHSPFEFLVRDIVTGRREGVLFTDDIRCPVHVSDLALSLVDIAHGHGDRIMHVAGPDALTRYELARLIVRRERLYPERLPSGKRAELLPHTPLDVRLMCDQTMSHLTPRVRGAYEFLR